MIQDSEPPSLLSSTADSVKSSAMQKKIRRKHFKNDSAVKAYKCDLTSQNINTPVKLYVCHSALNLVHRPKRKIMTTLPFSQIVELKIHDEKTVKIYTVSNEMYTLTNFDRPDSAIAFLRNYWEVILKEKSFSASTYGNSIHNGLPSSNNNNPLSAHRNAVIADLYNRLLISKGSTTVSLTSTSGGATGSISNSETDSVTGSQRQEIDIPKCTLVLRKPASESSNLSKFDNNSVEMDPTVESTNFVELTNTAAITTTMTTTTATTPTGTSTPITAMAIASPTSPPTTTTTTTTEMSSSSSSFIGSMTNSFSFPTVSSSSSFNMGKDSIYHRQKMFNNSEGINNNTNNNVNINNNKSHHSVSTDWNWWPLNLLTCMFSSTPPQRFTMLIAYAILGFLFLSTVHLYHRLALIDLQTGPAVRRSGIIPSSSSSSSYSPSMASSSSSSELHNLELQLTHLTQLASKMVDGLSHLTSELNSLMTMSSNPEKFSPDQSSLNT